MNYHRQGLVNSTVNYGAFAIVTNAFDLDAKLETYVHVMMVILLLRMAGPGRVTITNFSSNITLRKTDLLMGNQSEVRICTHSCTLVKFMYKQCLQDVNYWQEKQRINCPNQTVCHNE